MTDEALHPAGPPGEESIPQPEGGPAPQPEPPKISYELQVSADQLQAYVRVRTEGSPAISLKDVKDFLKSERISHGVVVDETIEEYTRNESILKEPCLAARGTLPGPGKDAQVTYHFERDPLKIGSTRTGGAIDFKNRGDIPQVSEGDLLAEKVPLVKEKPGTDVFGKPVPVEAAKDILFSSGPGTKRSADGLKIYSRLRGRPELLADGKICVFPEIKIKGDVGVVTGHIRFDGFVDVEGCIQEGYKVKAGRLAAKEVFRAEIESDGDIVIDGGIVGAKIVGRGNLKTRFIHSSQITVLGDVMVEREVIDSRIETNAALIAVPNGRVFTSQVSAKKGISAAQIGSLTSKPCSLKIGVDLNVESIIKKMKEEILQKETEKKKIRESLMRLNQALMPAKEKAAKYNQVQDQLRGQLSTCKELIERCNRGEDRSRLEPALRETKMLEEKLTKVEEELQKSVKHQHPSLEKISACEVRIEELDESLRSIQQEIQKIREESQTDIQPPVKVPGQIFAGTIVEGCHSSQVVKESLASVLMKETRVTHTAPEGTEESAWGIQVSPL